MKSSAATILNADPTGSSQRVHSTRAPLIFRAPVVESATETLSPRVRELRQRYLEGTLVFDEQEVAHAMLCKLAGVSSAT